MSGPPMNVGALAFKQSVCYEGVGLGALELALAGLCVYAARPS